ncbi:putative peptidase S54, rhomboid [Helianthus debilis subsp. tardiflorus]
MLSELITKYANKVFYQTFLFLNNCILKIIFLKVCYFYVLISQQLQFGWVNQRYTPAYSNSRTGAKPKYKTYQRVLWLLSLILVVAGRVLMDEFGLKLIAGLVSLVHGVNLNDHCSWCHYLSCVPTSPWSCDTDPVSCMSEQTGNQYTLTCSDGGKNGTYLLDNPNQSMIRSLCSQLCR